MKFEREDLEITNAAVPEDADRNSPEYRSKIRAHYDSLKEKFPQLTCADYARANPSRLTARNFQKWCTSSKRSDDKAKIKKKASEQKVGKSKEWKSGKQPSKACRTRFSNSDQCAYFYM